MAATEEFDTLSRAFSGLGVEEKSMISILGKWHPQKRQSFRQTSRDIFIKDDGRQFEKWDDRYVQKLQQEFLRFKETVVLWTMHPWERDARLLREAVYKGPQYGVLIEISCTRSSEELLGARRAYHSLFDHSIEEDVAFHVQGIERMLLVGLVSSYRYEGPKVRDEIAKSEAKMIHGAIKEGKKDPIEEEDVVRILTTRSKLHIRSLYQHYKEITGNQLDEDLRGNTTLKQTIQCMCLPQQYFSEILDASMKSTADEISKEGLTRALVTRADVDMELIKEEYHRAYGVPLAKKIEEAANGNYRDFLLTSLARGD